MLATPRPRRLLACALVALAVLAPTGRAALENGTADLPGTTWDTKGRLTSSASGGGESVSITTGSGPMTVAFPESGVFTVSSDRYGDMTGTYAQVEGSTRKVAGAFDVESLSDLIADFERRNEKAIRRRLGLRANVSITVKSTSAKAKLNRAGTRLRVKGRIRFKGRVSARGGSARIRGAFRASLSGREAFTLSDE